jgi:two-component system sensor histidine kinase RegB
LIYDHVAIPELSDFFIMEGVRVTGQVGIPQAGALVAFSACSSVIVYFMTRLTDELRLQERELRLAQDRQAQGEKLEALGTLAAGAAHELATPLSTIAIVAREVESQVERGAPQSEIAEDVRLIRSELDRCRTILDQMSADAGQAIGESFTLVTVGRLLDEVLAELPVITGLPNESAVKVELNTEIKQRQLRVPLAALAKAIRGLIKNAVDASRELAANNRNDRSPSNPNAAQFPLVKLVEIQVYQRESKLCFEIRDYGMGMTPEVMRRISEPFFTTKPVGKGMGLGVFLARSIVLRIDGQISFDSQPGKGTTAKIMLELVEPEICFVKKGKAGKSDDQQIDPDR